MTVQNKKNTFGTYIRSLRLYRGFGLRELARQLGISAPYLSDLEKDKRGRRNNKPNRKNSWALQALYY